jgi:hypothetical protein
MEFSNISTTIASIGYEFGNERWEVGKGAVAVASVMKTSRVEAG